MFTRPSQLPAGRDLRSKQAAHCTVRSARSGTQRGERMLLNKMYSPLWESSDANWLASVSGSEQEGNGDCALPRVCACLFCEQHTGALCVLARVCMCVSELTSVGCSPLRVCPAAALSGGGNGSQWRVVLHGESISDN